MKQLIRAHSLEIGHTSSILKGLSFEIFAGELICLMGANGCGKTTLLRTLAGLIPVLNGEIWVQDWPLANYVPSSLAQLISVVLTDKVYLPRLTARQVVAMGRYPYSNIWGGLKRRDRILVEESLEFLHCFDIADLFFETLSDGQKQKVMIARALAQDTPIIFLDEPTTFLDMPHRLELIRLLKEIAQRKNKALLFSSHDWELALSMIEKVWLIDKDGNLKKGLPEDLILNGTVGEIFSTPYFCFDQHSGSLCEKIDYCREISVEGADSVQRTWTIHALKKAGYRLGGGEKVILCDKKWRWRDQEFVDIASMLKNISEKR